MKTNIFKLNNPFRWENQAKQYPEHGSGIQYFRGEIEKSGWVDCLLFYGRDNQLEGILNYYPVDIPSLEKMGNFNLFINPSVTNTYVSKNLLDEAISKFEIDFDNQTFTPEEEYHIKGYLLLKEWEKMEQGIIEGPKLKIDYITELISAELDRMDYDY